MLSPATLCKGKLFISMIITYNLYETLQRYAAAYNACGIRLEIRRP